jgi:hypothetical protein
MTQVIPQVSNNATQINSAEFVKVTIYNEYPYTPAANIANTQTYIVKTSGNTNWTAIGASSNAVGTYFTANTANGPGSGTGTAANVEVLTFSSSYKEETINGNVYDPLGGLLSVGSQTRNLRATSGDTTITLSGIDGNNITTVLDTNIRGSEVEILRGFYYANMVLNTANGVYPRFRGIITSYGIEENREGQTDDFTVSVNASSYKAVLENRIAGRKTNKESWQYFNPGDTSMDQVYALSGVNFDFGQKPKAGAVIPGNGGFPAGGGVGSGSGGTIVEP